MKKARCTALSADSGPGAEAATSLAGETLVSETLISETLISETLVSETLVSGTLVSGTLATETLATERDPLLGFISTNVTCAVLGLLQTIFVARTCGPTELGVAAAITSILPFVINVLDVRVSDLAFLKLCETPDPAQRLMDDGSTQRRAAIIQGTAIAQAGIAVLAAGIGIVLAHLMYPFFFPNSPGAFSATVGDLLWLAPTGAALSHFVNYLSVLQRALLSGRALNQATLRAALINTVMSCLLVAIYPSAFGILLALNASALVSIYIFLRSLTSHTGTVFSSLPSRVNLIDTLNLLRANRRLLISGNLFGYVKALHRGADVLLVSLFCGPLLVGLYKFARNLTDNASIFTDALQKRFAPQLVRWASLASESQDARTSLRRFARRSILIGAVSAGLVFTCEYLLLADVIAMIFGAQFRAAAPLAVVFTVGMLILGSVNLWLWPWALGSRRVGEYTRAALIATVCGQYIGSAVFVVLLVPMDGGAMSPGGLSGQLGTILAFALGHTSVYLIQCLILSVDFTRATRSSFDGGQKAP